ncbi:hypothetical protein FJT64_004932 [Amphibalanus amphitrite]|uniref:DNA helicase Pif1-like 2B domain-containing protein n=1 Tax=Amphibalanus amphitrite TaxID=1232801 RepID=A0A6A4W6E6_AMPAM|nr:hypothetical protein FJT64_004932 [Amphibalanus amphitrite]
MSDRSPAVLALQVHLEDHQLIFFQPGEERQAVAGEPRHTQLTAWMTYNRASAGEDPECLRALYPDFPQKYRWDAGQKRWHRRRNMQAAPTIGRVVSLTPRHGDVFYLRVLLHHVPGATTFAELRTVDGQVCGTHQEACRRRGLLLDDQEWAETLAEAVRTQRPGQLRQLFVVLLLFCAPADPATLLHRFQAAMGEDFARRHPELPPETVTGLVLLRISDSLQRAGKTLEDFGLPPEENQQAELEEFSTWLLQLGNGELPTDAEGRVTLPPALVLEAELPAVIDWTFGNLTDADSMASRAVLAPTNSTVDSVNSYVTDIFPGQAVECLSVDATVGEEQEPVPQEYLNGLCVPGLPPHHLLLKPGMPVILLRNIDPARGLCNGTRLLVVAVHGGRLLEATVACGSAAGRRVLIPRLTLQPPDDAFPFEWRWR